MPVRSVLIRGGHLLDPNLNINLERLDVLILDGKVERLGKDLPVPANVGVDVLDASGCFVSPGWVDIHAHVYEHATELGVNPDRHCLARGVTTVVDAGSAGAMTLQGLRHFVANRSKTRVLSMLHIAVHGLAGAGCAGGKGGESDHLNALQVSKCVSTIRANRDLVVGIKVRLDVTITDGGRNEHEALLRAMDAAKQADVPLMVHRTNSNIPLTASSSSLLSCPGSLRPGDIYTHCFHPGSIRDPVKQRLDPDIVELMRQDQDSRVLFDVGHGQGSFDWRVAEAAASLDLWPDTISTDLHSGNVGGAACKDLPNVMSKFLTLGMPLKKVIAAVTSTPSKAIGRGHEFGSLTIGSSGDVTVFKVRNVLAGQTISSPDSFGAVRDLKTVVEPIAVVRRGEIIYCDKY